MPYSPQTVFDDMYAAAISNDSRQLQHIFNEQLACINLLFNGDTPVKKLAREGRVRAVNFLIGKYNADISEAAQGYAEGGHRAEMHTWLSRGADCYKAIEGRAFFAGEDIATEQLLDFDYTQTCQKIRDKTNNAQDIQNCKKYLKHLATGYGYGNHIGAIELLITTASEIFQDHDDVILTIRIQALYGLAKGNHKTSIDIISAGKAYHAIFEGWATGGHVEPLISCFDKIDDGDQSLDELRIDIILELAINGNEEAINRFDDHRNFKRQLGYIAARGGHIQLANQILLARFCNQMAAISAENNPQLKTVLCKQLTEDTLRQIAMLLNAYIEYQHFTALSLYLPQSDAKDQNMLIYQTANDTLKVQVITEEMEQNEMEVLDRLSMYSYGHIRVPATIKRHLELALMEKRGREKSLLSRFTYKPVIDNRQFHRLFSTINNPYLMNNIITCYYFSKKLKTDQQKIMKISQIMASKNMSYDWALAWHKIQNRLWFLQCRQLTCSNTKSQQKNKIVQDTWLYVSTFLTGFTMDQTWEFINRDQPRPSGMTLLTGTVSLFKKETNLLKIADSQSQGDIDITLSSTQIRDCITRSSSQTNNQQPMNSLVSIFKNVNNGRIARLKQLCANNTTVQTSELREILSDDIEQYNAKGVINRETQVVELISEALEEQHSGLLDNCTKLTT